MASSTLPLEEDPLIAALPPVTDYITYLTIIEYQLNPQNLVTLNKLLASDDGKLAEEIGWDLLKLVLPMLQEIPGEATTCLETIARRGNPREVVVRVAEELETLCRQVDEDSADVDGLDEEEDDLPTFAGEAARIHLGKMTLDGMPESLNKKEAQESGSEKFKDETEGTAATDKPLKLQALLLMLGILHPRIKTQYPSRFLATSLPPSLGAYRRLPRSEASTVSFLSFLGKLAGKQRPPLPHRVSTKPQDGESSTNPSTTMPLPDPEAPAEAAAGINIPSENEKAIITRLLRAVMLEVLDEYLSSMQTDDIPCMSWTSRLRETMEPRRVVPGKQTETHQWGTLEELKERDNLMIRFLSLAKELALDAKEELVKIVAEYDAEDQKLSNEEEEVSEYPTSPSQISYPSTGLIQLYAASLYYDKPPPSVLSLSEITSLVTTLMPLSESPTLPSPAVQDALLSILYQSPAPPTRDAPLFLHLLSMLTRTFTMGPHALLRDSAHHIATTLLHAHPDPTVRLNIIKQTIQTSTAGPDSIPLAPPFNEATLQAVGVNWLKDEFVLFLRRSKATDPTTTESTTEGGGGNEGIDPSVLSADKELQRLAFQTIRPPPSASQLGSESESESLSTLLTALPFHIATLNLACILGAPSNTSLPTLSSWRDVLISILLEANLQGETAADLRQEVQASAPDIFALDDACRRAQGVLEKLQEREGEQGDGLM